MQELIQDAEVALAMVACRYETVVRNGDKRIQSMLDDFRAIKNKAESVYGGTREDTLNSALADIIAVCRRAGV